MAVIDWVIVGLYLSCALGIGIYFTKRASKSTSAFFVAGRTLPWYIAGTSMVATTFAADTPLWVAGTSRQTGIFNNWIWWSSAFGFSATVFFFARLWRRTEILTDIELVAKRYEPSKARNALRIFRVFFDGVMINCTIIAWITLAMVKIIKCVLGLSEGVLFTVPFFGDITPTILLLLILGAAAVTYTTLSGLYGVAYSDLIAFIMAMGGSIALAVIIYVDASSGEGLIAKISAAPEYKKDLLKFFPDLTTFNLVTFTFFVYVFMRWWEQAPGAYYLAQRMLATRSEKDSVLAFLWFNICQFVIRPWPWILVGILSLHYLPRLDDPETAFPLMIARFMPIGLKGLVVTSLFAAFMSSIDTQLNLGTSYLINDFYRPYVSKNKSPRHYVLASRIVMILMTLAAILVATKLKSVFTAWKYIVVIVGGLGTVMIARWYWWRVNAYSEISAMVTCFFVANGAAILLPSTENADFFAVRLVITVTAVAAVWVLVTFLTSKQPDKTTIEFYTKMKIGGPGWKKVRQLTGIEPIAGEFKQSCVGWLSCTVFILGLMLSIGRFLFHQWLLGVVYLLISLIAGFVLKRVLSRIKF